MTLSILLTMFGRQAHADDDGGLFVGANVGRAPIDTDNAQYQSLLQASASGSGSLVFTKASLSKRDAAWSIDGGYMIWQYLGVEASYLHFGRVFNQVAGSFTPTDGTAESVYAATLLESRGPALGILLRVPLAENIAVDLRLADYYGHTSLTNTLLVSERNSTTTTANSSSLLAGMGVSYSFGGHWSAKADFLRVDKAGNTDTMTYSIDMVSVGASYTF